MAPHPLFAFRSKWDLTLLEASEFFDIHPSTISGYEHKHYPMPEWLEEWLADPMMNDDEIRRRVEVARRRAAEKAANPPPKRNSRGRQNPIREWRRRKGLTQKRAAKELGVYLTTISAWELGDRIIPEKILRRIDNELES